MWWGHGFHPLGWLFFALLAGLVIFKIVALRGCAGWYGDRFDARSILKRRLAAGEITEDEYRRLKQTISE